MGLLAENERNLPRGSRDRPMATAHSNQTVERDCCHYDLTCDVLARARRHLARRARRHLARRARRHGDVRKIGAEVLSMANFEFCKSDHN